MSESVEQRNVFDGWVCPPSSDVRIDFLKVTKRDLVVKALSAS